jgi:hypothetical protein
MGLRDIIAGAVATAKGVVGGSGGVMDTVTIQFWIRDLDEFGSQDYSDPVPFEAIVVRKQEQVVKPDGQLGVSQTYLAFLEEIPDRDTGHDRKEPLDERDVITLSDGTTGPTLKITGLMDSVTHTPYYAEVYLG